MFVRTPPTTGTPAVVLAPRLVDTRATTPMRRHAPTWRRMPVRWIGVLAGGAALYGGVLWAILAAHDPLYVPTLLLVGAAVVPAAFVTFVNEIGLPYRLSAGVVATTAVLGGVIGSIVAGQLEAQTLREFGSLQALLFGLIEESSKLAIPAMFLLWPRVRTADGLLLGVTVGSGFAVLETMGYGFVSLLVHGGHLAPVTRLLVVRAVAAPGGHAAWTGLACAALFAIRGSRRPGWAWARFGLVFAGVVGLHAAWDSLRSGSGCLVIGAISLAALMAVTWWLRRPAMPGPAGADATGENRANPVLAQGSPVPIGSAWGSPRQQPSVVDAALEPLLNAPRERADHAAAAGPGHHGAAAAAGPVPSGALGEQSGEGIGGGVEHVGVGGNLPGRAEGRTQVVEVADDVDAGLGDRGDDPLGLRDQPIAHRLRHGRPGAGAELDQELLGEPALDGRLVRRPRHLFAERPVDPPEQLGLGIAK